MEAEKIVNGCFKIIAILLLLIIIAAEIINTRTTNAEIQTAEAKSQEKPYKDNGLGIMTMSHRYGRGDWIEKGYLQWKKDYPERAKKTVAISIDGSNIGTAFDCFYLIYKTE